VKDTIPAVMFDNLDRAPDRVSIFYPAGDVYKAVTTRESVREVARIARGLHALGVGPGTPIGILADTRREWTAVDLAALCLGAIVVGIYPTLLADQVAWQLRHAGCVLAVVENAEQAAKIVAEREGLAELAHVLTMDPVPDLPDLASLDAEPDLDWLRATAEGVAPGDIATIIYTSGTTGLPKGVVLTHGAFVAVARATVGLVPVEPGDCSVVWLPLAHSFQRFAQYRGMMEDIVGYYAPSLQRLAEALLAARPQVLVSVPRMLEKIRDRVAAQVAARGGVSARLYRWAFAIGHRRLGYLERGESVPRAVGLAFRLADRLVFHEVKERLGGRLRVLVSGGAALNPDVARWYGAMGLLVLEGWGLTETCAPATMNTEDAFRIGTVGRPIPGVEVRIAEDGEILVKSPGLLAGYYRDPEATAEVMRDGWFATGDIGTLDADGFLSITDRKKAILVTAGGKNIAPVPLEKRLEAHPLVGQSMVVGSERRFLAALLVPDPDALDALAVRHGWPEEAPEVRQVRPEVQRRLQEAVDGCNDGLARFETIKRWAAVATPFTVESGELTPTLKLKRRVVEQRHQDVIEALYAP